MFLRPSRSLYPSRLTWTRRAGPTRRSFRPTTGTRIERDEPSPQAQTLSRELVDLGRRTKDVLLLTATILCGGVLSCFLILEGNHKYAARVLMVPAHEHNQDIRRWEWDEQWDHWNGDLDAIGPDPGLPWYASLSVCLAWLRVDKNVAFAGTCLRNAFASLQGHESELHPSTLTELLLTYASVLERAGPLNWQNSKGLYSTVFTMLGPNDTIKQARIALKLGDLHYRLGETDRAFIFWRTSVQLCTNQYSTPLSNDPTSWIPAKKPSRLRRFGDWTWQCIHFLPSFFIPRRDSASHPVAACIITEQDFPSSPALQRTLASTYVSVSAALAAAGKLEQAEEIEVGALRFIGSLPAPSSIADASPSEALHHLYLLQCSSVLSIHMAEVLYGRKRPLLESTSALELAARSSGLIFRGVTASGLHLDRVGRTHPSQLPPSSHYSSSPGLTKIANQLLIDACTAATEAYNLIGHLYEPINALLGFRAFEFALWWSSKRDDAGVWYPADGVLQSVFQAQFDNAARLQKDLVKRDVVKVVGMHDMPSS